MKKVDTHVYHWLKLTRRYRTTQEKWLESRSSRLARRLDILGRRLHLMNRKWKLGIAATSLTAWMSLLPSDGLRAQGETFPSTINLTGLDGSNGFTINGVSERGQFGRSVSNVGDVNGDGIDDLMVGAPRQRGTSYNSGVIYVIFGTNNGFPTTFDVTSLDGTNGFRILGESERDLAGEVISNAGDINGDGFDDLIIGVERSDPGEKENAGSAYVVFGSSDGFGGEVRLSSLDGANGFIIRGKNAGDRLGVSVGNAGDLKRRWC